ncbi:MAG: tRNA dihydrouridine synthase DusB [Lachnospiraceae bacterium]|nr:tRNA dihydrouridine synthase DusB [Lachnospiraceae bacterium]
MKKDIPDKLLSPLSIGNCKLNNPLILAPMAGVTDLPFRLLCHEMGAGLVCMEMVSAKAIYYGNKNTELLMETHPEERPVSLQLFGSDPDIIAEMAAKIQDRPFDILDFNMGCPVPKVVNNHEGSALMKNPQLVREILTKLVRAVSKPVTVKIRKGFDAENENCVEIAKIAEDCGVSAVAVHGRTREQYYSGNADWECIAKVKEALTIPVIGNGDVTDYASAGELIGQTGCDGVMIGRAVKGNPFVFRRILIESMKEAGRENTTYSPEVWERNGRPDQEELQQTILKHAALLSEHKGEKIAVLQMRSHLAWYSAGLPGSASLRRRICCMETMEQLSEAVKALF